MLISVKPTNSALTFQSDLGQYNVIKKHLQLWFNSSHMGSDGVITIKEFTLPDDVKTLELIDLYRDERLKVPVSVFKKLHKEGEGYSFVLKDLRKKYFNPER